MSTRVETAIASGSLSTRSAGSPEGVEEVEVVVVEVDAAEDLGVAVAIEEEDREAGIDRGLRCPIRRERRTPDSSREGKLSLEDLE